MWCAGVWRQAASLPSRCEGLQGISRSALHGPCRRGGLSFALTLTSSKCTIGKKRVLDSLRTQPTPRSSFHSAFRATGQPLSGQGGERSGSPPRARLPWGAAGLGPGAGPGSGRGWRARGGRTGRPCGAPSGRSRAKSAIRLLSRSPELCAGRARPPPRAPSLGFSPSATSPATPPALRPHTRCRSSTCPSAA